MMADALRRFGCCRPLYQSLSVHPVEINPVLREKTARERWRRSQHRLA